MYDLRSKKLFVAALGLFATLGSSYGFETRTAARCSDDNLEPGQAIERTEWATRCGHMSGEDREDALLQRNGQPRPRPMYPVFTTANYSEVWRAPVDRNAPCTVPPGYGAKLLCTSSCYTPDQEILFPEGFVAIKEAKEAMLPKVITLDPMSMLDDLKLKPTNVETYTEEIRNTWHDILHFHLKSGGELKVTKNHPVLDDAGYMRTADSFKVGESFVHYLAGKDVIQEIKPLRFFGKVYNLAPRTEELVSHVLIAQGYLNGSSHFQNDAVNHLGKKLLRKNIPDSLLE